MKAMRTLALTVGMLLAVGISIAYTPKPLYASGQKPEVSLESLIPKTFGGWAVDESGAQQVVSPAMAAALANIYSDNVGRTYVNAAGDRVMLSLAYGADQSRAMQVHKPEVCYEAQGLHIVYSAKGNSDVGAVTVPVMRLEAKQERRIEPITYWIRTGDYVVRGWLEQNVARVKNGLVNGFTPDGLLVRVSTIDDDRTHAYAVQDQFLKDLVAASSEPARAMLLGKQLSNPSTHH